MNNPNNNPTDNTDAYDAQGSWGAFADHLAQFADWEARNERDRLDKENN